MVVYTLDTIWNRLEDSPSLIEHAGQLTACVFGHESHRVFDRATGRWTEMPPKTFLFQDGCYSHRVGDTAVARWKRHGDKDTLGDLFPEAKKPNAVVVAHAGRHTVLHLPVRGFVIEVRVAADELTAAALVTGPPMKLVVFDV